MRRIARSSQSDGGPPRVAVICQVMAHYRESVHKELDASEDLDFTFASDPDGSHYALKTMPPTELRQHVTLRNRYWGRATWQTGVMSLVFSNDFDAYVFTGDASVLTTWIGAAIVRLRKKPVLFWTIGWHRPERGVKSRVRIAFYRLASHLMVYGNTAKRLGSTAGYPSERISVIYNSVGEGAEATARSRRTGSGRVANVGAIARLNEAKRFDLLLRAVSALNRGGTSIRVTLGGEGPERGPLQLLARELGVELDLRGAVYGVEDTLDFYAELDATVIPTYAGLSIIQSLSHGVPVVTDDDIYGQGPEWEAVTEKTGKIFKHGDVTSLTEALSSVLDSISSDEDEIAAACLAEVRQRWTARTQAVRIEEAVENELTGQARRLRSQG